MKKQNRIINTLLNPKAILGIIISVGGLYWAFKDFQFQEFKNSLNQVKYFYVFVAMFFLLVVIFSGVFSQIENSNPKILFWVGCAGSFDERYKKVTKAFIKILNKLEVDYAVLGKEEGCTGDPARRAGNEYLFQMQALIIFQH